MKKKKYMHKRELVEPRAGGQTNMKDISICKYEKQGIETNHSKRSAWNTHPGWYGVVANSPHCRSSLRSFPSRSFPIICSCPWIQPFWPISKEISDVLLGNYHSWGWMGLICWAMCFWKAWWRCTLFLQFFEGAYNFPPRSQGCNTQSAKILQMEKISLSDSSN